VYIAPKPTNESRAYYTPGAHMDPHNGDPDHPI